MHSPARFTLLTLGVLLGLSACSSTYYLIKDPQSGREYYTSELHRSGNNVSFQDAKTLSKVTLQNSEITEITHDQYRANTGNQ